MSICLVLGGNGFIGSHIVESLVGNGYNVRVFDKFTSGLSNLKEVENRIELIKGDFLKTEDIKKAMEDVDYIFHNIGLTIPSTSIKDPIYDTKNITGSVIMIQEAIKKDAKKIIFSSSGGTVYGEPREIPVPETHLTNPICPYGISKLAVERYLNLFNHLYGLDYCVLRYSNAYGERQNPYGNLGVIPIFLRMIKESKQPIIYGDGENIRDYVYVKDIADANLLTIKRKYKEKIFNVGSGRGVSLNELVKIMSEVTNIKISPRYVENRVFDVRKIVLDISRIKRELGWEPKTDLRKGIEKTWKWISEYEKTS